MNCEHCWHNFEGAYWGVLHSGQIIQECCKCHAHRTIHRDHAWEPTRPRFSCRTDSEGYPQSVKEAVAEADFLALRIPKGQVHE